MKSSPTLAALLLGMLAAVHLLPDVLALLGGGTRAALAYVLHGVEAAALWALVFALVQRLDMRAISAWGMFEAVQRPACRLAFPLDKAPPAPPPGENLCDVVTGLPMSVVSVLAALFLAALVQEVSREAWRA